jgi:hypothetical protein
MTQQARTALIAIILFLPFFLLNMLAGQDNEAFDTFFKSVFSLNGMRTNPLGHFVFVTSILLMPIGSIVALRPALKKGADGKRRGYVVNILFGAVTLLFFIVLASALITEVYRCDVLLIPNCD